MERKWIAAVCLVFMLFLAVQPALAAQEDSVILPGWFAWLMVVFAVGVPVVLGLYLKGRGHL